jgi:hypothetical protein
LVITTKHRKVARGFMYISSARALPGSCILHLPALCPDSRKCRARPRSLFDMADQDLPLSAPVRHLRLSEVEENGRPVCANLTFPPKLPSEVEERPEGPRVRTEIRRPPRALAFPTPPGPDYVPKFERVGPLAHALRCTRALVQFWLRRNGFTPSRGVFLQMGAFRGCKG